MQNLPDWITNYGLPGVIVILLLFQIDKVSAALQKVIGVFAPNVAERMRHTKEQAKWRREQIEREYVDTVKAQKDFLLEMKGRADDERQRADDERQKAQERFDKQRSEWQQRFDEQDRIHREERTNLQRQVELLAAQKAAEYKEMVTLYERLESRHLSWQQTHTEIQGSMMRRLDQMALILAGRMGFPDASGRRGQGQKNNAG
jgi:hypothetical protein